MKEKKFVIDIQELKVAVDIVVFSKNQGEDFVLLMKRKYEPFENLWAIPGGFVKNDEELEDAAIRELHEETGFEHAQKLVQIGTFGKVNRDPRRRVISIAYLIVTDEKPELSPDVDAEDNDTRGAKWFRLNELPEDLAFDHSEILKSALEKYSQIQK